MTRSLARVLFLLAMIGGTSQAHAHLMLANKGTVSIKGNNAYVALSVPVSALSGFDDNHDKLIDITELGRHTATLREQIDRRISVRADGTAPIESVTFLASALTGEDENKPIDYLVALIAMRFEKAPEVIAVQTDLFGAAEKDQQLALTASHDHREELAVLSADHPEHHFFLGGFAVFTGFVGIGVSHILLGFDHLLFLLTIIAAAMSVRQWIVIISGFTLAHSITLTAASLGFVSVSPQIVEPLIAASIVALALDNLVGGTRRPFLLRASLVFACGLLHGLGFASSLADYGLSPQNIWSSLLGFNLGVELGQLLFVSAACGALWFITRLPLAITRERLVVHVSALAALPATALLAVRLFPLV